MVASSSEQISTAEGIARSPSGTPELDVQVWNKGVFDFSASYGNPLEKALEQADYAAVVLTADDRSRGTLANRGITADNVNFELGLFIGGLGAERCFFLHRWCIADSHCLRPLRIEPVTFIRRLQINHPTNPPLEIQEKGQDANVYPWSALQASKRQTREEQEKLWRFSETISGFWWERMRKGEDDMSAISYLKVTVDPVTNTPCLDGRAYDRAGRPMADWHSMATSVVMSGSPLFTTAGRGQIEEYSGQIYGGAAGSPLTILI